MIRQQLVMMILMLLFSQYIMAQQPDDQKDTFFLAKKRGLLGRLGKSIAIEDRPTTEPVKIANPFLPFAGATISSIEIVRLGFDRNINDTTIVKHNFGLSIANALHKNTLSRVIANDLLFRTGDKLFPNLMADNERLLHEQVYLQDARILVKLLPGSTDSVDVIVITKDVFSLGGSVNISSQKKGSLELKEENVGGHGSRIALDALYDKDRDPKMGYGAEFMRRNINGSFVDWSIGFKTYNNAYGNSGGRNEETEIYTAFEKPLVTPYIPWTGALRISYNKDNNYYSVPSYDSTFRYTYYKLDGWFGYNFGSQRLLYKNLATRLRKFIAVRALHQYFSTIPEKYNPPFYDYRYANITGVLGAINIFMQDFYRANFIYGFGRNEDVPEGFSTSLIGGWTNQQGRNRPYFGLDGEYSHFSKRGLYSDYMLRVGAYNYQHNIEDFDILFNVYHFTRLKKLNDIWFNRNFITASITKQMSLVLNQPLFLQSDYGLPYIGGPQQTGDFRTTFKGESVFFNMKKFLGFRFAPFVFGHMSLLTPTDIGFSKSDIYTAWGGGVRTRNENLIFGTIELKGYYIPRTLPGTNGWRIELNSNLQFKFNSTFIKQPDFVIPN